ncbi:cell division protein FtsQ/DivIB [Tolypothrix campylonemoides VB511288]|nr:cell division protein FtsQ/DivIB [Tolypothrix campylonemoides VB511288]
MNAVLRLAAWVLALALVALPIVAVLNGWIGADQWPLTKLRVTAPFERVDEAQLRAALLPHAKRGFFAIRIERAQADVARLPWVARAEVRKRWPDTLEVVVVEHTPFARWGADRVLSTQGRLFAVRGANVPAELPRFDGPDARAADVVALYNQSRALFAPIGLQVRAVALDARGSWALTLDNGARVIVGRTEANARLGRFARLLPRLLAQGTQRLVRADLRYTNGFALEWTEKPALGTRNPGLDTAAPRPVLDAAPSASARLRPTASAPLLRVPSPESRVPRTSASSQRITAIA